MTSRPTSPTAEQAGKQQPQLVSSAVTGGGIQVCVRIRPPMIGDVEKKGGVREHSLTHDASFAADGRRPGTTATSGVFNHNAAVPWSWSGSTLSCRVGAGSTAPVSALNGSTGAGTGASSSSSGPIVSTGKLQEFRFAQVFTPESQTIHVYDTVARPIVKAFTEGYDGCVFAYGQTGSGKTHTISGAGDELGVLPLAVNDIFAFIKQSDRSCVLRVAFIEIYNEIVRDLLAVDAPTLNLSDNPVHGVTMPNLECRVVSSLEEVQAFVAEGQSRRMTGANSIHEHSSRSHSLFQLIFESRAKGDTSKIIQSVLNVVDLAGSETNYVVPVDAQAVVKERAELKNLANAAQQEETQKKVAQKNIEGSNIRKSLLALIRCVDILSSAPPTAGGGSGNGTAASSTGRRGSAAVVSPEPAPGGDESAAPSSKTPAKSSSSSKTKPTASSSSTASTPPPKTSAARKKSISGAEENGEAAAAAANSNSTPSPAAAASSSSSAAKPFVPFRDSKLTRILRNALAGNSHAAVICTVNPAEEKETLNSVRFAAKCQKIYKGPRSVVVVDEGATVLAKMEEELERMQAEMAAASELSEQQLQQLLADKNLTESEKQAALAEADAMRVRAKNLERLFMNGSTATNKERRAQQQEEAQQNGTSGTNQTFQRSHSAPIFTDNAETYYDKALAEVGAVVPGEAHRLCRPTPPVSSVVVMGGSYSRLYQMNNAAIEKFQDETTKSMLARQRQRIEELEKAVSLDSVDTASKIAALESQLAAAQKEKTELSNALEDRREEAVHFAKLYMQQRETLQTMPSGLCAPKPRLAPMPSDEECLEEHPDLKKQQSPKAKKKVRITEN